MPVASKLLATKNLCQMSVRNFVPRVYAHSPGHNYQKGSKTWMYFSLFLCTPALIAGGISTYYREINHRKHLAEHGYKAPNYEWNIHTKDFPWGDGKTPLFDHLFPHAKDFIKKDGGHGHDHE